MRRAWAGILLAAAAAQADEISERMKAFVAQGSLPGAVTMVARDGKVVHLEAVGAADREASKPMRPDTIFDLRSMTKPVVCLGVMILAEEGRVALTDPVERYLPEFRGQQVIAARNADGSVLLRKPSRPPTLRDMMTHTSGMPLDPPAGLAELHVQLHKPLPEVALILSQQPLEFEPGSKWQYSNTGIATLARIIEVVSGKKLEVFLEERVFRPLAMKDTFFFPPPEKHDRIAIVYRREEGKVVRAAPGSQGGDPYRKGALYSLPEGGLYSTAADLFALYQMMLDGGSYKGGRILSKAGVEGMTALHTGDLPANGPGLGYGLGWSVVRSPLGELLLQSKGSYGHGGRFGTYGWIDPARKMITVFLVQREGGSEERNAFLGLAYSRYGP